MSGLSTKDVQTGGGLPKVINPGEHVLKINNVELKRFPFMEQDQGYYLMLNVETPPIEGFQGFLIDKDAGEDSPRYEGQIGQVKTNRFYYKDGKTKSGIEISRDMEILKQLKNICIATGTTEWFDDADGKYPTIEAFVDAFNSEAPYKNKFLKFCIAGKEFERNNGYIGHDMFLPKLNRGTVAFEDAEANISKLLPYSKDDHYEALAPKEVESFGEDEGEDPTDPTDDLLDMDASDPTSGAPEFEL